MLENYKLTQDGIIQQIQRSTYDYNLEYTTTRYVDKPTNDIMSYLRLGYVIGSIGHIPSSLLDVGYGSGNFLKTCQTTIPTVYGNDVQPAFPLPEGVTFVQDPTAVQVEVVTFFDSLEHFPDIEFVKELNCKYVIISLPWCHNGKDETWFSNWKHRRPDEHLYHFDESSLVKFMSRQGYKLVNYSNLEDCIRVDKNLNPNILTGCFQKVV